MTEKYAVLPCNGLDKAFGPLSREVALAVLAARGGELVCPVLLHRAPARYAKATAQWPLLVIDGCATRCASRLANEQGLPIARKLQLSAAAKAAGTKVGESLTPGPAGLAFCQTIVADFLKEAPAAGESPAAADFPGVIEYEGFAHDKFLFRVPKSGYLFNENDCWVRVSGNRARVGISDYMQQSLSDIMFCTPPEIGAEIEQFGEAGTVESSKAVFEVVSPVSGKVVAVNMEAADQPELINEDPYERGWIAELELADFESDRGLLLDCSQYLELVKKKAAEFQK